MPKLDITELDRELKQKKIRPLYVVVGTEYHLLHSSLKRIEEELSNGDVDALAKQVFSAKEVKGEEIVSSLKTFSLLGGRPTVIIREGESLSKSNLEILSGYLDKPVESSTLIIVAEKIDGRSRFMQLATKVGAIVECKPLYFDKLPNWINMEAKKQGRQIAQDAAKFLAEMIGNDLGQLYQAIDRVILYVGDKKMIETRDVDEAIAETHQHTIFELADAVGTRQLAKSLSLMKGILENGESPVFILNMLARHYRLLTKAREVSGRMPETEMAKYLGVNPYFLKNYMGQAKNFSATELRKSFRILHKCDRELKSSKIKKDRVLEKTLFALLQKPANS